MKRRILLPSYALASYHPRVNRFRAPFFSSLAAAFLMSISASSAAEETQSVQRIVVNRIVAVIDQDVVTLVELKRRAEPFQKQLSGLAPEQRAAAESQLNKDLLQQAIDDRLIAREARALHVSVTSVEIERALDTVAQSKNIKREKLFEIVAEQGFSEAQYREQLVRQLLVGKLLRIRMAEELKNVDKDPDKASKQYERIEKTFLQGLRANMFIEVRL